jgi:hypothetical protein
MKRSLNHLFSLALLISLGMISTQASAQFFVRETPSIGTSVDLVLPVNLPDTNANGYWSGLLNITASPAQNGPGSSFEAFCIDPSQFASPSASDYFLASGLSALGNSTKETWVSNLYSNSYASSIGSTTDAAAFQLALWDLAKDDGNLSSGSVRSTGSTNTTVLGSANSMITAAKLGAGAAQYSFSLYTSATAQDYVVATSVTAVPEPETYAMLLSGMCLLGFTARRRLQKAKQI